MLVAYGLFLSVRIIIAPIMPTNKNRPMIAGITYVSVIDAVGCGDGVAVASASEIEKAVCECDG